MNKKKKMGAKAPAKKMARGGKSAGYMTTRRLSASAAKSGTISSPSGNTQGTAPRPMR